jgi:hypothetical protein
MDSKNSPQHLEKQKSEDPKRTQEWEQAKEQANVPPTQPEPKKEDK